MTVLLVAAALAGCTGGTSNEGQPPSETPTGSDTGSRSDTGSSTDQPRRNGGGQGHANQSYDAYLEVAPDNGTAPLNVTLTFGATWQDNGRHTGQQGNGSAGSSGNRTGNGAGNGQGNSGNATGEPGQHPVNGGHDVTWTLEVRLTTRASSDAGNATGNSTGTGGNATGNQTGNGTSSGNTTTVPPAGNSTSDGTAGNGTVVASFNGTGADLPGNESVLLNETGTYTVTFVVTPDDGSDPIVRDATLTVEPLPPGTPLGNVTRTFEGSFLASTPLECMGSEEHEWALNETFQGLAADVSRINATAETSGLNDLVITLVAPNGTEVESGSEINLEGPFEAGTYALRVESCLAANAGYTVTAIAHYATKGGFA